MTVKGPVTYDREYILPLALGAVTAVLLHVVLMPSAARAIALGEVRKANLSVVSITAPDDAEAGSVIDLSFVVSNIGEAGARFGWQDRVYLSLDNSISADDRLLATLDHVDTLRVDKSYQATCPLRIPQRVQGEMHLIVRTGTGSYLLERDRDEGNSASVPIDIALPLRPDLVASAITVPERVEVDKAFEAGLTVANQGPVSTGSAVWRDTLYVSSDDRVDADDTILATIRQTQSLEGGVSCQFSPPPVSIPERYAGGGYLILRTDADDAIEEYPQEKNNTLAVALAVRSSAEFHRADPSDSAKPATPADRKPKPTVILEPSVERDVQVGSDDGVDRLTVAWISHDDFLKLQARKERVIQPAVQKDVDPVENARIEPNPEPPRPPAGASQPATAPMKDADTRPAEQIEARSQVPDPAPPIEQVDAIALKELDARATDQPPAVAPVPPREQAVPIIQEPADTPKPTSGSPTQQTESAPPRTINADPLLDGPSSLEDSDRAEARELQNATGPVSRRTEPTSQIAAMTDAPEAIGTPALIEPAEAPERTDGQPTLQQAAETPMPDPEGSRATAEPIEGPADTDPNPAEAPEQAEWHPVVDADTRAEQKPGPNAELSRPTAADRAEKESDPFDLTESFRIVPGHVIVRRGIEIQTVKPRFGVATRVSMLPGNPTAKVRFDRNGRVIRVWLTRSSGYPSVDLPVVASMYRWRAKGKKLAELNRPFELEINMILVPH